MLPLWARVDLGAMAMKEYFAFPKAPTFQEPHHQIVYCHIQNIRCGVGGLATLQRKSRCILQPQPTGQGKVEYSMEMNNALAFFSV